MAPRAWFRLTSIIHPTSDNYCAITGNAGPSDPAGTQDVDGGKTTLSSDVYDLSSYINPAFTYWRWYSNDQGATPGTDFWQTFISNDGVTWVPVEYTDVSDHSWRRFAFRVSDYVQPSPNVYLRFVAEDANAGQPLLKQVWMTWNYGMVFQPG